MRLTEMICNAIAAMYVIRDGVSLVRAFRTVSLASGGMIMIDLTNLEIPEDCKLPIVVTVTLAAVLFGLWTRLWLHEKAADSKVANGKIATTSDLPYNKYYDASTVVGTIMGAFFAYYVTPIVIANHVIGADPTTYAFCGALLSAALTIGIICLLHWGVRLFVVNAKEYAYQVKEAIDDPELLALIEQWKKTHPK